MSEPRQLYSVDPRLARLAERIWDEIHELEDVPAVSVVGVLETVRQEFVNELLADDDTGGA